MIRKNSIFVPTISNQEINELELNSFSGEICLIEKKEELSQAFYHIKKERFVGFDTETKPSFRKGEINQVSLIQIATSSQVFLIRINKIGIGDVVHHFLESGHIQKVGVALRDDIKDLQSIRHFRPAGFLELNQLVKGIGIESNGLRKLTAIILGFRISKSAQTSNWENAELTDKQKSYAATDAWVCYEMYDRLTKQGYF